MDAASDSALLYTMTTIAETLGGAIALMAAFALYRLQSLAGELNSGATYIADVVGKVRPKLPTDEEQLMSLATTGDYGGFVALMDEIMDEVTKAKHSTYFRPLTHSWRTRVRLAHVLRPKVQEALWLSLIVTGIVMTFAIATLAAFNGLQVCLCVVAVIKWLGVAGFVGCLATYFNLISIAVGPRVPGVKTSERGVRVPDPE